MVVEEIELLMSAAASGEVLFATAVAAAGGEELREVPFVVGGRGTTDELAAGGEFFAAAWGEFLAANFGEFCPARGELLAAPVGGLDD